MLSFNPLTNTNFGNKPEKFSECRWFSFYNWEVQMNIGRWLDKHGSMFQPNLSMPNGPAAKWGWVYWSLKACNMPVQCCMWAVWGRQPSAKGPWMKLALSPARFVIQQRVDRIQQSRLTVEPFILIFNSTYSYLAFSNLEHIGGQGYGLPVGEVRGLVWIRCPAWIYF